MMPLWLAIVFAVAGVVVPVISGYVGGKRGVQKGIEIGMAVYGEKIRSLEQEVVYLRNSKHEHSQRISEHEAWIEVLKRKAGVG